MQATVLYRSKFVKAAYEGWIWEGAKVLEIGLGDGIIVDELRKHFKCDYKGTDIIDSRKREVPLERDIKKIPDKSFDIATMTEMIHHCKNWEEVLADAKRVAHTVLLLECEPTYYAHAACWLMNIIHYGKPNWRRFRTKEEWGLEGETRHLPTPWWYPFKYYCVKS